MATATPRADAQVQQEARAMRAAMQQKPVLTGRKLRRRDNGGIFAWTPELHASGEFELVPEEAKEQPPAVRKKRAVKTQE